MSSWNIMFSPGVFWAVLGPPRSGKTTLLMYLADIAMSQGWIVISNVILRRYDLDRKRWVRATHPNYYCIKTFSELFQLLPGLLRQKKSILLAVDEAMMSSMGGGRNLQSAEPRTAATLMAQIGKFNMSLVIVAQFAKALATSFRVGGLVSGYMRKTRVPGYSIQEVVRFEVPDPEIINFDPDNLSHYKMAWRKVNPKGIARNQQMIVLEDGTYNPREVIYEPNTPASLRVGTYPNSSKIFDVEHMLELLTDVMPDDTADAIEAEMKNPTSQTGSVNRNINWGEGKHVDNVDNAPGEPIDVYGRIRDACIELFKQGHLPAQVYKMIPCARSEAYKVYKEWRGLSGGMV